MGLIRWAVILLVFTLAYNYIPKLFAPRLYPVVEGFFHPKFRKVAETIRRNVESGKERGGAFTVYHRGEKLIDMWFGYADVRARRPWSSDTMTILFSATKAVAAITIAKMVDNGWLDYDKPVAHYWPEFAQKGKGDITVAQLLAHEAGLVATAKKRPLQDIRDKRQEYIRDMEEEEPAWTPGTTHGYHAVTFGMYVDVLAQKADPQHRNMTQIFQEEIATPYNVDIFIGLPKTQFYRMARGYDRTTPERLIGSVTRLDALHIFVNMLFFPDSFTSRAFSVLDIQDSSLNSPETLNIGMSSFLGVGTAEGLAKLYSYLAMAGTVKGKQLLSSEPLRQLLTPRMTAQDEVLLYLTTTFGPGTMFKNNTHAKYKGQLLVGHPGAGGQIGFADPTNQLSMAYITNFREGLGMWDDPRYMDIKTAFYDCFHDYMSDQ